MNKLFLDSALQMQPPPLTVPIHPQFQTLISGMLRKVPGGRPGTERVSRVLSEIATNASGADQRKGISALANVGATDAQFAAQTEAIGLAKKMLLEERKALSDSAFTILGELVYLFKEILLHNAPTIVIQRIDANQGMILQATLRAASITIKKFNRGEVLPINAFHNSKWDVIVGATILVEQHSPHSYEWGANLWYTNLGVHTEFRWWEVPYFTLYSQNREPHAEFSIENADLAASLVSHNVVLAARPKPIDDEDINDFCNRWAEILAKAYRSELERPRNLPMD